MPRDETMRDAEHVAIYEAQATRCWACWAKEVAMTNAVEANGGKPPHGWFWHVAERSNGA